ncbi:MAG TPA: hypothetical protein VJ975_05745 [Candidatus Limnocylindria bacterium]|nr:hypothetical protein [Candidatus Limnocylindria bacterium]
MSGPAWGELPNRARIWRVVHAGWSIAQLAALGHVWVAVLLGRRSPAVWVSTAFLAVEGGALVVGRGGCPMGPTQESWGDPVPFFELILTPRAAKAAIPVLWVVSAAAIVGLVLRPPGLDVSCGRSRTGGRRRRRARA